MFFANQADFKQPRSDWHFDLRIIVGLSNSAFLNLREGANGYQRNDGSSQPINNRVQVWKNQPTVKACFARSINLIKKDALSIGVIFFFSRTFILDWLFLLGVVLDFNGTRPEWFLVFE
jgi:hypothetical protein